MPYIPPFMGTRGLIPLSVWAQLRQCGTLHCRRNYLFIVRSVWVRNCSSCPGVRPSSYCRYTCCPSTMLLGSMLHFFLQLSRWILSVAMRFTVGVDAEHYTFGANAAFLLLLVHVLPFTMLLGSMLAFFFLCTCSDSYCCPLQSVCYSSRRYCALHLLILQVGISPLDAILGGKQPFYWLRAYTTFLQLVLALCYPF